MTCSVCDTPSAEGQFCVTCGAPMGPVLSSASATLGTRERARPQPGAWLSLQEIRLLACPTCGAPNSAARWRCARCGTRFDDDTVDTGDLRVAVATTAPPRPLGGDEDAGVPPESARWLMLITVVAGVAVVSVAVLMLAARGIGPFARTPAQATVMEAVEAPVQRVDASSAAASARNLIDDDPATAWIFEPVAGESWVELRLEQPVQIDHLMVWNGDQSGDEAFDDRARVKDVLIQFPDAGRDYRVRFKNLAESFQIEMDPAPPVSDVVRIRVESVYGDPDAGAAISELEALVVTPSAP